MENLKDVFIELSALIDEGNSDALDLVQEIRDMLGQSGVADDVRKLELQINDYEFEEAGETFARICEELNLGE
ncbi:hypothetical protein QUF80_20100 [Desulfococcaceae bacterium HSG8]|nr:hypothetical protein [Desulfococcaceae bacterium HSG8]